MSITNMEKFGWIKDAKKYWSHSKFWDESLGNKSSLKREIRVGIDYCLHQQLKDWAVFIDDLEERLDHLQKSNDLQIDYSSLRSAYFYFDKTRRHSIKDNPTEIGIKHPLLTAYKKIKPLFPKETPGLTIKIGSIITMEDLPYQKLKFFLKHHPELMQNQEGRIGTAFDTRRYILETYPEKPLEGENEIFSQYTVIAREHRGYQNLQKRLSLQFEIINKWYDQYKGELQK